MKKLFILMLFLSPVGCNSELSTENEVLKQWNTYLKFEKMREIDSTPRPVKLTNPIKV